MPKYLAKFTGTAVEYSFGGNHPYKIREERQFEADNENQAKEVAEENRKKISKGLLSPKITLNSLFEVKSII